MTTFDTLSDLDAWTRTRTRTRTRTKWTRLHHWSNCIEC